MELVKEVSGVALIAAIFAGISAVNAVLERAFLADAALLHSLVVEALNLVHEEEYKEEAGQDNGKPRERALHVLDGKALASLLLAVSADTLEPMLLELVNFDNFVNEHEEFQNELRKQDQLAADGESLD